MAKKLRRLSSWIYDQCKKGNLYKELLYPITIHVEFRFNHVCCIYERAFIHFPIGSYVKNCCGGHLGFLIDIKIKSSTESSNENLFNIMIKSVQ